MEKLEPIDNTNEKGKQIITAPLVYKAFVRKNAEKTDIKELYVQRSVQDYFIKFCESEVGLKELENALSKIEGEIKTLTMEVSFREGLWDVCDENELQQSRVGPYIVIHKIVTGK